MRRDVPRPDSRPDDEGPLVRAAATVDDVPPSALLRAFRGLRRGFWERDGPWCAWAGAAARLAVPAGEEVRAVRAVRRRAEAVAGRLLPPADDGGGGPAAGHRARFYGGFAFDPDAALDRGRGTAGPAGPAGDGGAGAGDDPWASFPRALFLLPAVELRGGDGGARLAVTTEVEPGADPESAREAARRTLQRVRSRLTEGAPGHAPDSPRAASGGPLRSVRRHPDRSGWAEIVEAALDAVASGTLEKVVPARVLELELASEPDPVAVTRRLRSGNPGCYPYLVEPAPGRAFAGAAPEIVSVLRDGRFRATAVAGTVADSADLRERRRLARRLLASRKDRREHQVGVRDMRRSLQEVAGVARVDEEPRVLRLRGLQHLLTNVTADVPQGMHVLELLEAMHPTAAVNGSPRAGALDFLRRREPFGRGWYAGPVGWFDGAGEGEFVPGLRSATLEGRRARLFAGAGVVAGSDPRREWEETGLKFRPALEALGVDPDGVDDARAGAMASSAGLPAGDG